MEIYFVPFLEFRAWCCGTWHKPPFPLASIFEGYFEAQLLCFSSSFLLLCLGKHKQWPKYCYAPHRIEQDEVLGCCLRSLPAQTVVPFGEWTNRLKGWKISCLFAHFLFVFPSALPAFAINNQIFKQKWSSKLKVSLESHSLGSCWEGFGPCLLQAHHSKSRLLCSHRLLHSYLLPPHLFALKSQAWTLKWCHKTYEVTYCFLAEG